MSKNRKMKKWNIDFSGNVQLSKTLKKENERKHIKNQKTGARAPFFDF